MKIIFVKKMPFLFPFEKYLVIIIFSQPQSSAGHRLLQLLGISEDLEHVGQPYCECPRLGSERCDR
jgi:hypothetical protein